jgi:hypothetical protein
MGPDGTRARGTRGRGQTEEGVEDVLQGRRARTWPVPELGPRRRLLALRPSCTPAVVFFGLSHSLNPPPPFLYPTRLRPFYTNRPACGLTERLGGRQGCTGMQRGGPYSGDRGLLRTRKGLDSPCS